MTPTPRGRYRDNRRFLSIHNMIARSLHLPSEIPHWETAEKIRLNTEGLLSEGTSFILKHHKGALQLRCIVLVFMGRSYSKNWDKNPIAKYNQLKYKLSHSQNFKRKPYFIFRINVLKVFSYSSCSQIARTASKPQMVQHFLRQQFTLR